MGNKFASGKHSIAMCDRCGQQFKLKKLRTEVIKTKRYNLLVCNECWDPDHPQLLLGMFPVDDPQAVRNPRRDTYEIRTRDSSVKGRRLNPLTNAAFTTFLLLMLYHHLLVQLPCRPLLRLGGLPYKPRDLD